MAASRRVSAGFDPLTYLCQQAHANGIEVHAWLGGSGAAMYRVSTAWPPANNTTLIAHPASFAEPQGLVLLPPELAGRAGYDVVVADTANLTQERSDVHPAV